MERHLKRAIVFADLIKMKATGTPAQLAEKLGISKSLVKKEIRCMREVFGVTIVFDRSRRSYVYKDNGFLKIQFERNQGYHLEQ